MVEEIQEQFVQGLWKFNCVMVMFDFFVRYGVYILENELYYDQICVWVYCFIFFFGLYWDYQYFDMRC